MASAAEDPILIPSDDEDCDDVVLIKEEIEVDSEDVIFLSETKPPPGPETAVTDMETRTTEASAVQDKSVNLSSKGSQDPVTSQLNDSSTDLNDNLDLCNYLLGPLDLSSKSDTQNQNAATAKTRKNDIQDILKSLIFDTDLYNNDHMDSSSYTSIGNPAGATVKDDKMQGSQTTSNILCDKPDKTSDCDLDKQNDKGSNGSQSQTHGADPTKCVSLPELCSRPFNIDSLLGVSSHSNATSVTSTGTDSTTSLTDLQASGLVSGLMDPLTLASNAPIASSSYEAITNCSTNSSQIFLKSTDPMWSSKDDYLVNKIKISLPCYQVSDTASQMPYSQSGNTPSVQTGSKTLSDMDLTSAQTSSVLQTVNAPLLQSGFQTVSQIDANLQQTSVSQSGNTLFSQTDFQTIPQIDAQKQISAGTQPANLTGSVSSQGLPGGSQVFTSPSLHVPLSNQSAFRCFNTSGDTQNSGNPQLKRSMSMSDQTYMYNPLTLPKSQKESYLRSFSTSSLNLWSFGDNNKRKFDSVQLVSSAASQNTTDSNSAASGGPYQLPPKKQKRCFSDFTCSDCKLNLSGEKCCKCPNGHATCGKCLEERVKKVLTGKAKESIRCLNVACDSFYPISELKLCLPSMVVEILEDKLGQDYVDYFSSMILKTAMDETTGETTFDIEMEEEGVGSVVTVPKKPAETDPELPDHWEPMNEKSGYQMFDLDVNGDEYNKVLPLFFSSMVNQKVEVVSIRRIQNPILWKFYSVKKKEMLLDNEGFGAVNEQQLYHGTDSSVVDAICKKGFDWRVCGKNGTMYGQGTYFAVNASYSHQYTDIKANRHHRHTTLIPHSSMNIPMSFGFGPSLQSQVQPVVYNKHAFPPNAGLSAINLSNSANQTSAPSQRYMLLPVQPPTVPKYKILPKPVSIRTMSGMPTWPLEEFIDQKKQTTQMFVARVLVGKYSGGSSKLRKPPPLDPKTDPFGKCYDSCVDNIHMPKIFVIFDSAQAYPEYLIDYTYE